MKSATVSANATGICSDAGPASSRVPLQDKSDEACGGGRKKTRRSAGKWEVTQRRKTRSRPYVLNLEERAQIYNANVRLVDVTRRSECWCMMYIDWNGFAGEVGLEQYKDNVLRLCYKCVRRWNDDEHSTYPQRLHHGKEKLH